MHITHQHEDYSEKKKAMGNVLRNPITEKETHVGTLTFDNDENIEWGVSAMQGWRTEQEDAHIVPQEGSLTIQSRVRGAPPPNNWGEIQTLYGHYLFCVFDGHGGKFAAKYASQHLSKILCRQPTLVRYARQRETQTIDSTVLEEQLLPLLKAALRDTFLDLDKELYLEVQKGTPFLDEEGNPENEDVAPPVAECGLRISVPQLPEEDSGCTVSLILLTPESIICASVGDSRAVLCQQDENTEDLLAIPLSSDHKPSCPREEERIVNAGGFVEDGRVDGDVAVSRALGDFRFKNPTIVLEREPSQIGLAAIEASDTKMPPALSPESQKLSAVPEISVHNRDAKKDLFLVCACDGIWDVHTNEEGVAFVSDLFNQGESNLGLACEELLDMSLDLGSQDNMTAIIVKFPAHTIGQGGGVEARRKERIAKQEKAEEEKRPIA